MTQSHRDVSGTFRSTAMLLLCAGLVITGTSLFQTLLPLRADLESFSTILIGFLGTAYFGGFVLGCLIGPRLIAAVGHIRCFAGVSALFAAVALLFPMWIDPVVWSVLRVLTGICLAVLYMVVESWLNDQADNAYRGQVLSIYIIVGNLATMAGQLTVNLDETVSTVLFSATAIFLCFSVVPLSLTPTTSPRPVPSASINLLELWRISPAGAVGCFLVGITEGAFWSLGPVFGQDRGMDVSQITLFMATFVLGGTISQWPLGRLSDSIDRRLVIGFAAVGTIVTGLLIGFWDGPASWTFHFVAACHGALMIPLYALCLAHANDAAPNERFVEVSSGLLLLFSIGAMAGPSASSMVMARMGEGGLFIFLAAVLGALAAFVFLRMVLRGEGLRGETMDFVPVPKTSYSVYSLEEEWHGDDVGTGEPGAGDKR